MAAGVITADEIEQKLAEVARLAEHESNGVLAKRQTEQIKSILKDIRNRARLARAETSRLPEPGCQGSQVQLTVDRIQKRITFKGACLDLQPTPFAFLELLAEKPGSVVPTESIYQHLYGEPIDPDHMTYNRQIPNTKCKLISTLLKLTANGNGISSREIKGLIKTRHRVGYFLDLPEQEVMIIGNCKGEQNEKFNE